MIEGIESARSAIRMLDQSRIGPILTGDKEALIGGGPGHRTADPEHQSGFGRSRSGGGQARFRPLTTCSSACTNSFMTDTAKTADIVLPATMFLEHDDFYTAGGSQYLLLDRS